MDLVVQRSKEGLNPFKNIGGFLFTKFPFEPFTRIAVAFAIIASIYTMT